MKALPPALLLLSSTACLVGPRGRVAVVAPVPVVSVTYVDREPPPPRYERIPPPPDDDQIWVAGCWRWDGRGYLWMPGHFIRRPHRRAVWVDGHWIRHERGWRWVDGGWR